MATSNTLAGYKFGIPVVGTAAHSWVMSFPSETDAFHSMQKLMGMQTVHLVDTYDTLAGTRKAIEAGQPLWGIRLDSGDFLALSKQARAMLDAAGFEQAKIMVSGDLDEYKIRELIRSGAPIDAFGVGTELATSGDAPSMGTIYKMVEIDRRFTAKRSEHKSSIPGSKQIFRFQDHDLLARSEECANGSEALLQPVMIQGNLICPLPDLREARERAAKMLAQLPPAVYELEPNESFPVHKSAALEALMRQT
jgi:nicotinate phosphoribosyltransferase